eukprot:4833782-Pleurochrysis_carterae.AAC.2
MRAGRRERRLGWKGGTATAHLRLAFLYQLANASVALLTISVLLEHGKSARSRWRGEEEKAGPTTYPQDGIWSASDTLEQCCGPDDRLVLSGRRMLLAGGSEGAESSVTTRVNA